MSNGGLADHARFTVWCCKSVHNMSEAKTPQRRQGEQQLQGQKKPFAPSDLQTIRSVLANQGRWRDLALFCTAIDTMLRSGDVLRLKVEDVTDHHGNVLETFTYRQRKTGKAVMCSSLQT